MTKQWLLLIFQVWVQQGRRRNTLVFDLVTRGQQPFCDIFTPKLRWSPLHQIIKETCSEECQKDSMPYDLYWSRRCFLIFIYLCFYSFRWGKLDAKFYLLISWGNLVVITVFWTISTNGRRIVTKFFTFRFISGWLTTEHCGLKVWRAYLERKSMAKWTQLATWFWIPFTSLEIPCSCWIPLNHSIAILG